MRKSIWISFGIALLYYVLSPAFVMADNYTENLAEQWAFYEQQLVSSSDELEHVRPILVDLPVEFDDITEQVSTYGTFIKTVQVPEAFIDKTLALELPFVYSAAKVYVNGHMIQEIGNVGANESEHQSSLQSIIAPIIPETAILEIVIQISSFNHIRGGFSSAPSIGEWSAVYDAFQWERYVDAFVIGVIFIAGIVMLVIGLLNRDEKIFLTFGLFSIVIAVRGLFAVPFLYHEVPLDISYVWATRMEYITTSLSHALYAVFIYLLYNKLFSKYVLYPGIFILLFITIITIFTEPVVFQKIFFDLFIFILIFIVYNVWIMFKALTYDLKMAKILLLGVFFVLVGLVIDFLTGMGIWNFLPVSNYTIALNVLLVLLSLCQNYVRQINYITKLNSSLDEKVKERTLQLNQLNAELTRLANFDGLTGIHNRHYFNEKIQTLFAQSIKNRTPLSMIMIDIDEFKKYNDYYGHVCGDELLIQVVEIIQMNLPKEAVFARYGGEEFVIILPDCTTDQVVQIGEQIRYEIEIAQIEHLGRAYGTITISLGIAERMTDQIHDEKELIRLADGRLYYSKENGRNQLTVCLS